MLNDIKMLSSTEVKFHENYCLYKFITIIG